jgi:hypothetical protein
MQRTGAHLCFEFAADFVLYLKWFSTLILIFCSSDQCTALHSALALGLVGWLLPDGVCELIAGTADVNAKDRCAFVFLIRL